MHSIKQKYLEVKGKKRKLSADSSGSGFSPTNPHSPPRGGRGKFVIHVNAAGSFSDRSHRLSDPSLRASLPAAGHFRKMRIFSGFTFMAYCHLLKARYREINQKISVDPVTSEHELTCQAEGYPEAEVIWTSRDHQQLSGETTITNSKRKEKLLNVTSTLRINTTANEIFYCTFRGSSPEENSTAELVIPERPTAPANTRTHLAIVGAIPLLLVALTVIFCLKRDVRMMDVEKCGTQDVNLKKQNDTQFEET
ncbi:programmed cell death 1 ligand 1 isoform X5 [Rhinolophus ferrumequinum]|uniref:programmed cell death 1 ligand 1 isoform X5 n=1 Tax=Rhinolophus ferrumequinum TaxID=59479 RepID=UPI00140F528C|nr:programmed cell death 1 ligand 1 isoform X5 [Rhinolophus ferrumequinum]